MQDIGLAWHLFCTYCKLNEATPDKENVLLLRCLQEMNPKDRTKTFGVDFDVCARHIQTCEKAQLASDESESAMHEHADKLGLDANILTKSNLCSLLLSIP